MRTGGGRELEPILEASESEKSTRGLSRWPQSAWAVVAVSSLSAVVLACALAWTSKSLIGERDRSKALDEAVARTATDAGANDAALRATISRIEAVNAANDRRREDAARELTANEFVMRAPIVVSPSSARTCRGTDLELVGPPLGAPPQLGFLRFFNRSGRPCLLLDYPALQGRTEQNTWVTIPVFLSEGSSYTDGPTWNGSFNPALTAVLSIRPQELSPAVGYCVTGVATPATYSSLRLVLPGQPAPVELSGASLNVGSCRPTMLLWAYDSNDA